MHSKDGKLEWGQKQDGDGKNPQTQGFKNQWVTFDDSVHFLGFTDLSLGEQTFLFMYK